METGEIHWFYDARIAKSKGAHPSSKWNQAKVKKVSRLGTLLRFQRFKQQCIPMIHREVPHQVQNEQKEQVQWSHRILPEHVLGHDDA